jgi:uncharacterized membrane protein
MQNRLTAVLTAFLIALTVCGIAFRFINLDTKDFWHDESETALVLSGHTEVEIVDYLSRGPVSFESLNRFQKIGTDSTLPNMYKVLREDEPGHAPFFYILEYLFCLLFGTTPMTMRFLTALISVTQLPIIYWLAREIYESKNTALFTTTLASLSPFLIYYAQEARDYSLGLLLLFLSGALLLYALRTNQKRVWIAYAATITIGLYSWLFMGIVLLSHGAFMLVSKWKWKERWLPFLLSAFSSALLFVPWLLHMNGNRENFGRIHDWLQAKVGMVSLIQAWAAIPSKPFALFGDLTKDMEQTSWMLAFVSIAAVVAALFLSIRNRKILLPILTACAWILVFAVPDATSGGMRSVFLRHQTPILASLILIFPALILLLCTHKQWLVKVLGLFIAAQVLLSETNSSWHLIKSPVWPTKAIRLRYELPVAQVINADQQPALVVCQQASTNVGEILGLSHAVKPAASLLFVLKDKTLQLPPTAKHLYLFNPLPVLEDELALKGYTVRDVANVHHLKTADASADTK